MNVAALQTTPLWLFSTPINLWNVFFAWVHGLRLPLCTYVWRLQHYSNDKNVFEHCLLALSPCDFLHKCIKFIFGHHGSLPNWKHHHCLQPRLQSPSGRLYELLCMHYEAPSILLVSTRFEKQYVPYTFACHLATYDIQDVWRMLTCTHP